MHAVPPPPPPVTMHERRAHSRVFAIAILLGALCVLLAFACLALLGVLQVAQQRPVRPRVTVMAPPAIVSSCPLPAATAGGRCAPLHVGGPLRQQASDLYWARVHSAWAIDYYARRWGQSSYWLQRLAWCESGMTPWAYNPSGASGLMQFLPSTYWYYANQIGERRSYWNAWGAANVAAYMWHLGQQRQWSCIWLIGYYGGTHWTVPHVAPPVAHP